MGNPERFESELERLKDKWFQVVIDNLAPVADPEDCDDPAYHLWAEAIIAVERVDQDVLPDQRGALTELRNAASKIHPALLYEILNPVEPHRGHPDGRGEGSRVSVDQERLVAEIDRTLSALPPRPPHRPTKDREAAVIPAVARVFHQHSGYGQEVDVQESYLLNLLLFVGVFCHQNAIDVPTSYDGLLRHVPRELRQPFRRPGSA